MKETLTMKANKEVWEEFTKTVKQRNMNIWDVLSPFLKKHIEETPFIEKKIVRKAIESHRNFLFDISDSSVNNAARKDELSDTQSAIDDVLDMIREDLGI